ncbi:MAG: GNAT family N-acetyltransferase [Phycisphaeraceae bacterium]|nr:GNAT family N-acetyltransferase [Phycisphaeraceae bacterium]
MNQGSTFQTITDLKVRPYEPQDQVAVEVLYHDGLLAGQIAPNDTGADIDNIQEAYFSNERCRFWVAEVRGQVLGMIGVAEDEQDIAEVRRLRVAKTHQQTNIGHALLETAINHCRDHRYLKVRLDTRFERGAVLDLFDRSGFEHTRTKNVHGKELLEFYVDLYQDPRPKR